MLTGENVFTAEERFFVSAIMMLGGFVQARERATVFLALFLRPFTQKAVSSRSGVFSGGELEMPLRLAQAIIVGNIALVVTNANASAARFRAEAECVMSTAKYLGRRFGTMMHILKLSLACKPLGNHGNAC